MPLELDRPRIPIRERSLLDILDLSLKVCSALAGPLLLATAVAALPLMLLNQWFLGGLVKQGVDGWGAVGYLGFMMLLVVIEAPLASVPATMLLGRAMFFQTQTVRETLADLRTLVPRLVWYQLMTRGIAAAWVLAAAIKWINHYGSHHTDAIVAENLTAVRQFVVGVDSSAVMVNASTRFNDGGEFGLGAEIGISTDKFHARGPCGLRELTSYKFVAYGNGHLRE